MISPCPRCPRLFTIRNRQAINAAVIAVVINPSAKEITAPFGLRLSFSCSATTELLSCSFARFSKIIILL
ncbi:hypothetical protein V1478_004951 [Vespula squamosa]|uniref:Uncharacterized protein n=1 Tax=Vespula squamosa TaxID=30214 RepID=A0ABD2BF88_VESSQ